MGMKQGDFKLSGVTLEIEKALDFQGLCDDMQRSVMCWLVEAAGIEPASEDLPLKFLQA